jgi:predicted O-linked N-acetylglucosamine transferase (SPINDLY family)
MSGPAGDASASAPPAVGETAQPSIGALSVAELFGRATGFQTAGQRDQAIALYAAWTAANPEHPLLFAVYFNYGVALNDNKDLAGAITAFEASIRLKPEFSPPYINLGRAYEDSGEAGKAVQQWMTLAANLSAVTGETISHKFTALQQMARVLEAANTDAAAEDALKQSLDLRPHQVESAQHWISLRQRQCKWPVISEWENVSRKMLLKGISSLSLANLADDPLFQLAIACAYAKHAIGRPKPGYTHSPAAAAKRPASRKLRIGYVSSDLRDHAVGFAMTDVVELHSREDFEIFAYYCGINRPDGTQARIAAAVDRWTDLNGMDDDAAAAKIAEDGVDILIDLNGYTKDARTKVFARRPAPINVNWFGYPGTMGTPYHHYIVADPCIIPEGSEIYYSEKVVRLDCYQPNDRKRIVAPATPTRAEAGLPQDAFVYCTLNGMQKITPRAFQRWMSILAATPNSVLWMLSGTEDANARLHTAAEAAGIPAERVIFADKMPNPQHLARYPLADLFLDSLPYGAHTTAADSLWMNVPILTLPGRSFASRVCASVLRAAGLGEMVCDTPEAFVARAIELGTNRAQLTAIKTKLAMGRDTSTLFDTPRLVRDLETLYRGMWRDFVNGELPVPDLRNLDIYQEIGLELDLENIEAISDADYAALYEEKLAEWEAVYPVGPDGRLRRQVAEAIKSAHKRRATGR